MEIYIQAYNGRSTGRLGGGGNPKENSYIYFAQDIYASISIYVYTRGGRRGARLICIYFDPFVHTPVSTTVGGKRKSDRETENQTDRVRKQER